MSYLLEQTLNGITLGGLYALIALGYTLVYGILLMINFAHSELFMVGGYVGLFWLKVLGDPAIAEKFPSLQPIQDFFANGTFGFAMMMIAVFALSAIVRRHLWA